MDFGLISVKLVTGFIGLWIMTRMLGKKEISQLTPFDFISSLMLSELVGNTIYDKDAHYSELLFALALWAVLSLLFEIITHKVKWLRRPLDGSPSLLIYDGKVNGKEMKKNKLDFQQLMMMLRQQSVFTIREVAFAVFETNGSLSILKKSPYSQVQRGDLDLPDKQAGLPVSVVEDGEPQEDGLRFLGKDKQWLVERLLEKGFSRLEDIAYAEWMDDAGLHVMEK